ncbi:MAG: hypothetical protein ACXWUV_12875, partial [Allosphingosinicella sp.]
MDVTRVNLVTSVGTQGRRWPALRSLRAASAAAARPAALRSAAIETWRTRDPHGIDISAIEHIDARSIAVIREDGADRKLDVALPS